jgi:hypothetical protein
MPRPGHLVQRSHLTRVTVGFFADFADSVWALTAVWRSLLRPTARTQGGAHDRAVILRRAVGRLVAVRSGRGPVFYSIAVGGGAGVRVQCTRLHSGHTPCALVTRC